MKIIPLHCVVFILGSPDDVARVCETFPEHEVLCLDGIARGLVGPNSHWATEEVVFHEMTRRMLSKLRLGERCVIRGHDLLGEPLTKDRRLVLANAARAVGVTVLYALAGPVDRETSLGDGVAEIIHVSDGEEVVPIPAFSPVTAEKFSGVTAIGDIHGMHQSFLTALKWARNRNHFVVLLGDILDYGPGSLEVVDEVYRMVMRGEAACVLGNHERKIMRWLDGEKVRLSEGNRITTNALTALGETNMAKWIGRFRGLYQNSHLIYGLKNVIFVHGALHPDYWSGNVTSKVVQNHAFFGEVDKVRSQPERPVRSYRWVDSIPGERIVVVGHDRRATKPYIQSNTAGGSAVFMDTGSGKGGVLSSIDFRFDGSEHLRMENFNIF